MEHGIHMTSAVRTLKKEILSVGVFIVFLMICNSNVYANEDTIPKGVDIEGIDISGMTKEEAISAANDYISTFTSQNFELDVDGNIVNVTAGELGYYWKNTQIIDEAAEFCRDGNVIERYKEAKDIENKGISYTFRMDVNDEVMAATINEKCGEYNVPHVNASLKREGNGFIISSESSGRMIDMASSVSELHDFILNQWNKESAGWKLTMVDDEPVATAEDCARVKDLLGTYSTKFSTSSANYERNLNLENGMRLLNGITLCQGETMSVNSFLEPWTEDNGWHAGGTYVNGRVEDSLGGGICQVSTTLYNAILNAEIEVVERFNHSMTVGYVPLSMDAALAGTWKDLKIRNNTDTPIYIEAIYSAGRLTFNIYGEETRPANRRVEYVSETTATIPSNEVITPDPTMPVDYRVVTETGHTGYKAKLWKKVYVDGNLESEEVINTSSYSASATYVTVGTGEAVVVEESTDTSLDVPVDVQPQTTTPQAPAQTPTAAETTTPQVQEQTTTTSQTQTTHPQQETTVQAQTQDAENGDS